MPLESGVSVSEKYAVVATSNINNSRSLADAVECVRRGVFPCNG